ncbi:MFS transporter [Geomicrobium sp. JCM 19037]|uniref:MFS transporter n=1 Tax=Geomicrobium sp. JCM 19037 TaxID=1460634 RepID=UPI001EE67D34|nr:MFS transporter [Geomicrobium sp. JCM 19037]
MFGPIGGVYADKWDKKKTMVITDFVRFFLVLLIPALYIADALSIAMIALISFALTSCSPFFVPASKAYIPKMVGKKNINLANGLLQTTLWPSFFIGAGLVGPINALINLPFVLVINALSFAIAGFLIMFIKANKNEDYSSGVKKDVKLFSSLKEGYIALRTEKALHFTVMTFGIYTFFWRGLLQVALPLYVTVTLGGGPGMFGVFMAVNGVGEMVGSLVMGKLKVERPMSVAFIGEILFGVAMVSVALAGDPLYIAVVLFIGGVTSPVTDIPILSSIQRSIQENHISKVFSYWNTMGAVGSSLGTLLIGIWLEFISPSTMFYIGGATLILVGALGVYLMKMKYER